MSSIGVLGFLILAVSKNAALSYFAVFLGAGGIYPCISNTITWVSNNCDGVYRRGITVGAVIAWGNMNGGKGLDDDLIDQQLCLATSTDRVMPLGTVLVIGWSLDIWHSSFLRDRLSITSVSGLQTGTEEARTVVFSLCRHLLEIIELF